MDTSCSILVSALCGLLLVTSPGPLGADGAALNSYILDYQPIHFDPAHLHEKHDRVKREIDTHFSWDFKAYDRYFKLRLYPTPSVFASDHVLLFGSEPPQRVDTSFFYEGKLKDVPSSSVHLSVTQSGIRGHIKVPGDTTYHIEPARNHFKDAAFHTIIYPESKMNLDPYKHLRPGSCGSKTLYEKLQNLSRAADLSSIKPQLRDVVYEHSSHNKYSAEVNVNGQNRYKRATNGNSLSRDKATCYMSLQADNLLYKHVLNKYSDIPGLTKKQQAREELLTMFAQHVNALNDIYPDTSFHAMDRPNPFYKGVRFQLQMTSIITECRPQTRWNIGYCTDNLDVSNFLDLISQDNHNEFCLFYTFTYRDFIGGTLGLAWVAQKGSPNVGFCGKYSRVNLNGRTVEKSLNTGIVTLINFGQEVAPRVSQLTFAHEVGHSFGAQHDETAKCAPFGTSQPFASGGNYIMFASASQGNQKNNAHFSPCSKNDIFQVLNDMAPNGNKPDCFKATGTAFCGNAIQEKGEACDCGYKEECSKLDKCCIGRSDTTNNDMSCTLSLRAECSPTAGQCCNNNCTYFDTHHICQSATECMDVSNCTGTNATCPTPTYRDNYKYFCDSFDKICQDGQCIGSVCEKIGWIECFMTSVSGASDAEMCYVACQKNASSECISSYDQSKVDINDELKDLLDEIKNGKNKKSLTSGVQRPPGYFCDDYRGYCDTQAKCQKVDSEGPFKQLTDMIFDPVTLNNIKEWIVDHWWAVLLMAVGLVVFMGVFVKIFSYNTPSKDPKASSQPPPTQPAGRSRPQPDKRSGAYSVEVPMQDRRKREPSQGQVNYGYQHPNAPPHPAGRGQQVDRIAAPKRY